MTPPLTLTQALLLTTCALEMHTPGGTQPPWPAETPTKGPRNEPDVAAICKLSRETLHDGRSQRELRFELQQGPSDTCSHWDYFAGLDLGRGPDPHGKGETMMLQLDLNISVPEDPTEEAYVTAGIGNEHEGPDCEQIAVIPRAAARAILIASGVPESDLFPEEPPKRPEPKRVPITVSDLIDYLQQIPPQTPVYETAEENPDAAPAIFMNTIDYRKDAR